MLIFKIESKSKCLKDEGTIKIFTYEAMRVPTMLPYPLIQLLSCKGNILFVMVLDSRTLMFADHEMIQLGLV